MMTKEQFQEFMKAVKESHLPEPPKDGVTAEFKEAVAKQKEIRAAAFKTKKYGYYIVGPEGAFVGGRHYSRGEVVMLPVSKLPSKTWKPATAKGVAIAEEVAAKAAAEAEELAGSAAEDDALEQDELDVGADSEDAEDTDEESDESDDEVDQAAPTPPPAPAKPKAKAPAAKPKPKAGKAGKPGRASDQDVA